MRPVSSLYETPTLSAAAIPFKRSTGMQQRWARQDYKATLSVTVMPEGLDWP